MNKAIFLDRDGVINKDYGYVHKVEQINFVDGLFDFCRKAAEDGFLLIVVTNQSGIIRGMFTQKEFQQVSRYMTEEFEKRGAPLTKIFVCPDFDECRRKPAPGMFLEAQKEYDIDMEMSISIGDKERDVAAAKAAGVGTNVLFKGSFEGLDRILSPRFCAAAKLNHEIVGEAFGETEEVT